MADPHLPPPDAARGMNRRALLQAAGLGAGLLAAGSTPVGRAAAATETGQAPRDASPTAAELPLTGGPEFPIGLFWPPPPYETTPDRYREITDAGFTFLITGNYTADERSGAHVLSVADQAGLKVLVAGDPRVNAIARYMSITEDRGVASSLTSADATSWLRTALAGYVRHPSFAGFSLYDEPSRGRFPTVGALTAIARQLAPAALPYANINRGNGPGYAAFVRDYVAAVRPALLSFDRYPILTGGVDTDYFDTWAIIREAALTAGIPAWTYIQSAGFDRHRVPTAAELAWQVNVSLAYGCKGIQYFTYWTPDPGRGEGYAQALITADGRRTPLYDAAGALNRGWLQPVGRQLKPLVSESVQHANDDPLPRGTTPFAPGDHLTAAAGDPAILGLFRTAAEDDGTRHLLVVNRTPDAPASVRLTLDPANVGGAAPFRSASGEYGEVRSADAALRVCLEPGGAALYRLSPK